MGPWRLAPRLGHEATDSGQGVALKGVREREARSVACAAPEQLRVNNGAAADYDRHHESQHMSGTLRLVRHDTVAMTWSDTLCQGPNVRQVCCLGY